MECGDCGDQIMSSTRNATDFIGKFENLDQVQDMIKKLQLLEEDMKKRGVENKNKANLSSDSDKADETYENFDKLPFIELDDFEALPKDTWLLDLDDIPGISKNSRSLDSIVLDTHLINMRQRLVNAVKVALHEDPKYQKNLPTVKRNESYVIRRESESPEKPKVYQSPKRGLDVSASLTYRVPSRRNTFGVPDFSLPVSKTDNMSITLPVIANSNAYSWDSPLNRTKSEMNSPPSANKYATITRGTKPNTTFSPLDSGEDGRNGLPDLNVTFVKPLEDEIMSSPSGSSHSANNISMEELHTKARMQEETLRSTPLKRRDTHVIDYHNGHNGKQLSSPNRTLSSDTYSVIESNTDSGHSGASSGVSSPGQSYENVAAPTVRQSMPNLALLKEGSRGSGLTPSAQGTPIHAQRTQLAYGSDPKLSDRAHIIRRPTAVVVNRYHNSTADKNKNKTPTFQRGDTFYKAKGSTALSFPPSDAYEMDLGGQKYTPNSNSGEYYYNQSRRGSDLSQGSSNTPSQQGASKLQKPKTRIPAPGGRMRF